MINEREKARPDGNRERAGRLQNGAQPCPIVLGLPPFPHKSHLPRSPLRACPRAFLLERVIGPPRPGDHRRRYDPQNNVMSACRASTLEYLRAMAACAMPPYLWASVDTLCP